LRARADKLKVLSGSILAAPQKGRRKLVALAGPPASGKSTLAKELAEYLGNRGLNCEVVPMDGFHLDNTVLNTLGLLDRKGCPESFDAHGFLRLLKALTNEAAIYYPTFDRDRDIAIAGSGVVDPDCQLVIVEGNYLLLDAPIWKDLHALWDYSIFLSIPDDILEERLVQRWRSHGCSEAEATSKALTNDIPNARITQSSQLTSDMILKEPTFL
jgi:pantothenate kinase